MLMANFNQRNTTGGGECYFWLLFFISVYMCELDPEINKDLIRNNEREIKKFFPSYEVAILGFENDHYNSFGSHEKGAWVCRLVSLVSFLTVSFISLI